MSKIQALFGSSLWRAQESATSVPNRWRSVCAACIIKLWYFVPSSTLPRLDKTKLDLENRACAGEQSQDLEDPCFVTSSITGGQKESSSPAQFIGKAL